MLGIDLQVRHGEILGVLGPNGAGKTTLIEILEGLRTADAGTAYVLGAAVTAKQAFKRNKHRIGVSLQNTVLPPLLTVEELLNLHRSLFPQHRDIKQLIYEVGLSDKRTARIKHLSGGQQQRIAVALALVGDPDLVFLDEPTSQLDPQARRAVWALLENQKERRNAAILVTTHQMEEAQQLCERVIILDHGQILAEGSPSILIDRYCPERLIEFTISARTELQFLGENAVVQPLDAGQLRVRVQSETITDVISEFFARQALGELTISDLRVDRKTLEDVFLKLTGRRIRD